MNLPRMFSTAKRDFMPEKISKTHEVPASIDTETNRGLRATVYKFDKNGKVVQVVKRG